MPRVNGKEFPYTAEGMREAKAYAEKTGKKLSTKKGKKDKRYWEIPDGSGETKKIPVPFDYQKLFHKKFGGKVQ